MMRMMHGVLVVASVAAALTGGSAPVAQADHVTCFVMAIGPSKEIGPSNAPIQFGYKVHCTGRPDGRMIETTLYRKDADGKDVPQAVDRAQSTDPDKEETFLFECEIDGQLSEYFTHVSMLGKHANIDHDTSTSDSALLQC